jgi:hemerythrin superfamily protein
MDALELLKTDHKNVKELFKKAEGSENKKQKQLFEQIKTELETHTHIEETIFYPAVAKNAELKDMVLESLEEHKQVKTLLREMENLASDSERFEPKLKVLMENVEHHAVEEEEGKMFPKVRKLMNAAALEELGQELEAAKDKQVRKAS